MRPMAHASAAETLSAIFLWTRDFLADPQL